MKVLLRGLTRAAGGVACVETENYRDLPRYLDDILREWSCDDDHAIRAAAYRMRELRLDRGGQCSPASLPGVQP